MRLAVSRNIMLTLNSRDGEGVKHLTVLAAVYDTTWVEKILETGQIQARRDESSGMFLSR